MNMKKNIALRTLNMLIMAVILFCLAAVFNTTYAAAIGIVTEGLNFRESPEISDNIITVIPSGSEVNIIKEGAGKDGNWYYVEYKKQNGYVSADYIEKKPADADDGKNNGENVKPGKEELFGKITYTNVNFRTGPGTNYNIIMEFPYMADVKVLNADASDGWIKVSYGGYTGYVSADYIEIYEYTPSVDFEESLKEFPESYRNQLRALHYKYPKWIFVPEYTGLDGNKVLELEYGIGSRRPSLIHRSQPDEWLSKRPEDYNPVTGEYTYYDGPFVAASKSAVYHFLDPRTSLDERHIFQFISSKYEPNIHKKEDLQGMLDGTFMEGKIKNIPEADKNKDNTYAGIIMEAAEISGVSPYTLASMILMEQGIDGRGGSISGNIKGYKGYYNYFNIGAYPTTSEPDSVINGLKYAKKMGWNTIRKSIIDGAVWYGSDYVNKGQYTQYLKKFNVMNGMGSVATHQYMTNVRGAYDEGSFIYDAYEKILHSSPLVFKIPVYSPDFHKLIKTVKYDPYRYLDINRTKELRAGPSHNSKLIAKIPAGSTVIAHGYGRYIDDSSWYEVEYNGKVGHITDTGTKLSYVEYSPEIPGKTTDNLYMRSGVGLSYDKIKYMKKGSEFTIHGHYRTNDYNWYKITCEGVTGYISSKYVEFDKNTVNYEPFRYLDIDRETVFREGPGSFYSDMGKVPKGKRVPSYGYDRYKDGEAWYKISYDGRTGYVKAADSSLSYQEYQGVAKGKTTANLYVRSGVGLSYDKIRYLKSGSEITLLGYYRTDGPDWYKIQVDGVTGYVSSKYVKKLYEKYDYSPKRYIDLPCKAYMRTGSAGSFKKIATIPAGSRILCYGYEVNSYGNKWYKVKYNNKTGYIYCNDAENSYKKYSSAKTGIITANLYMREELHNDSKKLIKMKPGNEVVIYGYYRLEGPDWYKVKYNGYTGYVSSKYTNIIK